MVEFRQRFTKALNVYDLGALLVVAYVLYRVFKYATRVKTTELRGPKPPSWLWGFSKRLFTGDSGVLYEEWAEEFGPVYQVQGTLGTKRVILADPKAVAHFYSHETFKYVQGNLARHMLERIFGRGLLWSEGESHRRQRKILTPAFSNQAIKELTPVFFDSVYKAKATWDALIDADPSGEIVLDVQNWMNRISLDSVGIAGFSHDFGSLAGKRSIVAEAFESFGSFKPSMLSLVVPLLAPVMPWLLNIPTKRTAMLENLNTSMGKIADELLSETRQAGAEDKTSGKSIIGALVKAEKTDSQLYLTPPEVLAQMKTLLLAGYETTSISLTWALIELTLHPEKQVKLREELQEIAGDASYDQLTGPGLPYLDGVVRETLRLHPPLGETNRTCGTEDVVPLGNPCTIASGEQVDRITVAPGTAMVIPIKTINRSKAIWGPDAWDFVPERWIGEQGLTKKALEIQGWGHILTFVDGPRTCLGRGFAVAEFKAVLSTLIKNYTFTPRDGTTLNLERARTLLPRPKLAGEVGPKLPLRIRRVDS